MNASTRFIRYGVMITAWAASSIAPRPSSMKCPSLAPAEKSTIAPQSATSVAIDMLGSSTMSPESAPIPTRNGSTPFLKPRTASPFRAASIAHQMTTASRASSEGCSRRGPICTQRRAPLMSGAMLYVNGSSGMMRKPMVTRSNGQAKRCHTR